MRNTKDLASEVKFAYAAGILDGEGSVIIYKKDRPDRKRGHLYGGHITVTSTTEQLIKWLQKEFGGSWQPTKTRAGCKQLYKWTLHGFPGVHVLAKFFPYLIVKRQHARLFFLFYKSINEFEPRKTGLDDATMKERDELVRQMHKLTRKGGK